MRAARTIDAPSRAASTATTRAGQLATFSSPLARSADRNCDHVKAKAVMNRSVNAARGLPTASRHERAHGPAPTVARSSGSRPTPADLSRRTGWRVDSRRAVAVPPVSGPAFACVRRHGRPPPAPLPRCAAIRISRLTPRTRRPPDSRTSITPPPISRCKRRTRRLFAVRTPRARDSGQRSGGGQPGFHVVVVFVRHLATVLRRPFGRAVPRCRPSRTNVLRIRAPAATRHRGAARDRSQSPCSAAGR